MGAPDFNDVFEFKFFLLHGIAQFLYHGDKTPVNLFNRVNWGWMQKSNGQFYGAWVPENGGQFSGGYGDFSEAALLYPQNANVAAAVALAGLGFEATAVELVADPDAGGNIHEIEAEGATGRFAIQLQGKPSRTNPKTSALAALSVVRALLNEQATIVI